MTNSGQDKPASRTVGLRIALGGCRLPAGRIADLDVGVVLELSAAADALVELYAGRDMAARGQAVSVDGKLALRIHKAGPGDGACACG